MSQTSQSSKNPPVVGNPSPEPALHPAAIQAVLCAGLLGARGAGVWVGVQSLELVWSRKLSPEGCPPERFQEFLKKCFARVFARRTPFVAKDTQGNADASFLFVPLGLPSGGVAVFSGDSGIWSRFQSSRAIIESALALISPAGPGKDARLAVPLLRSTSARGAAGICTDHLCEILGAKRVSVIRRQGKKTDCWLARAFQKSIPTALKWLRFWKNSPHCPHPILRNPISEVSFRTGARCRRPCPSAS